MKIAIYSPYLDTAGGGEKYMMAIAEILSKKENVDVLLDRHLYSLGIDEIKDKINKFHGLDFSKVSFIKAPVDVDNSVFERFLFFQKYDFFFSNTDGSIPVAFAKNNILHFQVPFLNTNVKGLWGKIKQLSWKLAICNSSFTKNIIKQTWSIPCKVVYPPVDIADFKKLPKKKQIITVGRFKKEKKQDILIGAFKKMVDENKLETWSLHIVGGSTDGDKKYIEKLKQLAKGYEVFFYENLKLLDLAKLYGESSIYWHAAGFLEDDPKDFEHFGITTVEAMTSGCVPVVIKKGGQIEIIEENVSGLFWENVEELMSKMFFLMNDEKIRKKLSAGAIERAKRFSKEEFREKIEKIVYGE